MPRIAIITDSDSSLSPEIARQNDITLVPITVHFDDKVFTTGVDINDTQLFEKVDRAKRLPTTAAPPPGAFVRAYQAAFDAGAEFDRVHLRLQQDQRHLRHRPFGLRVVRRAHHQRH